MIFLENTVATNHNLNNFYNNSFIIVWEASISIWYIRNDLGGIGYTFFWCFDVTRHSISPNQKFLFGYLKADTKIPIARKQQTNVSYLKDENSLRGRSPAPTWLSRTRNNGKIIKKRKLQTEISFRMKNYAEWKITPVKYRARCFCILSYFSFRHLYRSHKS